MALILYLEKRKLPSQVIKLFTSVENGNTDLIIPAIVVVEIGYLSERGKIDAALKKLENSFLISKIHPFNH